MEFLFSDVIRLNNVSNQIKQIKYKKRTKRSLPLQPDPLGVQDDADEGLEVDEADLGLPEPAVVLAGLCGDEVHELQVQGREPDDPGEEPLEDLLSGDAHLQDLDEARPEVRRQVGALDEELLEELVCADLPLGQDDPALVRRLLSHLEGLREEQKTPHVAPGLFHAVVELGVGELPPHPGLYFLVALQHLRVPDRREPDGEHSGPDGREEPARVLAEHEELADLRVLLHQATQGLLG